MKMKGSGWNIDNHACAAYQSFELLKADISAACLVIDVQYIIHLFVLDPLLQAAHGIMTQNDLQLA